MTLSRRGFLAGSAGAAAAGVLAACGIGGSRREPTTERTPLPSPAGRLSIATWPLYIDVDPETRRRPTLDRFEDETGIEVSYKEVVDDNDPFFSTIREPLSRGRSTGWDIVVVTDWLAGRMQRLNYIEQLHPEHLPTVQRNLGSAFRTRNARMHTVPWQAGITGIAYNPRLTGREITSFDDLFDPAFAGKVGMLSDMRDMLHLTLLWRGVDPHEATMRQVTQARDALVQQRDRDIVRGYFENDYTDALANGDLALCLAYSGDIFQLRSDNPDLRFVVPEDGGMLWVDEMAVPAAAEHAGDAHRFMDFVYRPDIAARITAYVQYISPVPAAKPEVEKLAAQTSGRERETLLAIARSPLIFPTEEMTDKLHRYRVLTTEEERTWNDLFAEVVEG